MINKTLDSFDKHFVFRFDLERKDYLLLQKYLETFKKYSKMNCKKEILLQISNYLQNHILLS